jgi:hypothetical protein
MVQGSANEREQPFSYICIAPIFLLFAACQSHFLFILITSLLCLPSSRVLYSTVICTFPNMPRPRSCTYFQCKQGLLAHDVNLKLNKTQLNHLQSYHRDTPVHATCPYTKKPHTFVRNPDKDMEYVCLCLATFTTNGNFHRHLTTCKAVNTAAGAQLVMATRNDLTSSSASWNSTIDITCTTQSHGELRRNMSLKGTQVPSLRRL